MLFSASGFPQAPPATTEGAQILEESPQSPTATPLPEIRLGVGWPADAPFNLATLQTWAAPRSPLPKELPEFTRTSGTLGASGEDRFRRWRLATVIVRSENGWGSGAFISADGWILTNYHVVAVSAQAAAAHGEIASLEVVTAQVVDGQLKPRSPLKATLYRADAVRDLALLKLDTMPPDRKVPYFVIGDEFRDGGDCYVIGSHHNGPAWWIRGGMISQQFEFPEGLSQFAADATGPDTDISRTRASVVVTDARVSSGDSGGPLLNDQGALIGVTFATAANQTSGSVGWHIALPHVREFVANLPDEPEGVPFDAWTAGLPGGSILQPDLADGDRDGRVDSLRYRYAVVKTESGTLRARHRPAPPLR
jgi:S1-C subfamily serine protease